MRKTGFLHSSRGQAALTALALVLALSSQMAMVWAQPAPVAGGEAEVADDICPQDAATSLSLYDELWPLFEGAEAGVYVIHGREEIGIGPGLEWQVLKGCEWLRFDLIGARSSRGSQHLIPGLGVQLYGGTDAPQVTLGICWVPSEYGRARIGEVKTYAAPYIGLRMEL